MNTSTENFYGWKLLAIFSAIYILNGAFPFYGASVMNTYMVTDLNLERSELGLGFTLFVLLIGISSPLIGALVNKYGARKVMLVASVLLTINALLLAFMVSQAWHFILIFGVLTGLVYGAASMIPVQTSVNHWFDKRRALALAIPLCAVAIGGLVATPLLNYVINATGGDWRIGWYVVAGATIVAAGLTLLVVDKPSDLGQHADGVIPNQQQDGANTGVVWSVKEAMRTSGLWLIIYGAVALFLIFNLCIAHGIIHIQDRGISNELATLSLGVLVATSLIGRIGGGMLADRMSINIVWCMGLILLSAGAFTATLISQSWHVFLYASLIGIGYGSAVVCLSAILGRYFGTASFAPILGVIYLFTALIGSLSPLMAGIIYDQSGSYSVAFYVTCGLGILGAITILFAKPPKKA